MLHLSGLNFVAENKVFGGGLLALRMCPRASESADFSHAACHGHGTMILEEAECNFAPPTKIAFVRRLPDICFFPSYYLFHPFAQGLPFMSSSSSLT